MKKENQIEILKTLSMIHRGQFDQRRTYEWRIIFATLGIFASSVAAKLLGTANLPTSYLFRVIVWIAFIILAIIASIYLYFVHQANETNKRFAHAAEDALMNISGVEGFIQAKADIPKSVRWFWSLTWQVMTLILFAVVCSFIITLK